MFQLIADLFILLFPIMQKSDFRNHEIDFCLLPQERSAFISIERKI